MTASRARSPYWPHASGFIPRPLIVLAALVTTIMVFVGGLLFGIANFDLMGLSHRLFLCVLCVVNTLAIATGVFTLFWGGGINNRIGERKTELWQRNVSVEKQGRWVSNEAVQRVLFVMHRNAKRTDVGDNRILLVTRLHWVFLLRKAALPFLGALVMLVVLATYDSSGVSLRTWTLDGDKHTYSYGVWLWPLFVIAFVTFVVKTIFGVLAWLRHFLIVTDFSVKTVWVYPVWIPWLRNNVRSLEARDIRNVFKVDSHLGGLLGYGHVDVSTFLQEDEDRFFKVNWVPRHAVVRDQIDSMRPSKAADELE